MCALLNSFWTARCFGQKHINHTVSGFVENFEEKIYLVYVKLALKLENFYVTYCSNIYLEFLIQQLIWQKYDEKDHNNKLSLRAG